MKQYKPLNLTMHICAYMYTEFPYGVLQAEESKALNPNEEWHSAVETTQEPISLKADLAINYSTSNCQRFTFVFFHKFYLFLNSTNFLE